MINITDQKIAFIINLLKKVTYYLNNQLFFENQKDDFFSVITGINNICEINESDIEDTMIISIYLHIIGGLELFTLNVNEKFYLVNIDGNYERYCQFRNLLPYNTFVDKFINNQMSILNDGKFNQESIKIQILNSLKNSSPVPSNNSIKKIAIITHNRPDSLTKLINELSDNFKEFGHELIEIYIFDDSDESFVIQNISKIESLKSDKLKIIHITPDKKFEIIENFIEKIKENFKDIPFENLKQTINQMFGGKGIKSSIGRNRNFSYFYLKGNNFISFDDDARPRSMTFQKEDILNMVEKMVKNHIYDLRKISTFTDEKNISGSQFLPVDFLGNFENYSGNNMVYSKYTGIQDGDLISQVIKKLGTELLPQEFGVNFEDKITVSFKQFTQKIQGLCCFFPGNFKSMNFSTMDNVRIEDAFIGINYLIETDKSPLNTNFSIYHDREIDIYKINIEDLISEIFSVGVFHFYKKIRKKTTPDNSFELYFESKFSDDFKKNFFKDAENVLNTLKKLKSEALKNYDYEKANYLKKVIQKIKNFVIIPGEENFINYFEKEVVSYVKNYSYYFQIWCRLEHFYFN